MKKLFKLFLGVVVGFTLVSCEPEGTPKKSSPNGKMENFKVEGTRAYVYGEYKKAEEFFRNQRYFFGGTPDPVALYNLGVMFERGEGMARDYRKAFKFYEDAARIGVPQAMYNLAIFYQWGMGIDVNADLQKKAGNDWLVRAADRGLPQAEADLASDLLIESFSNEAIRERRDSLEKQRKERGLTNYTYGFTLGAIPWVQLDDYQQIISVYEELAKEDQKEAQFQLGSIYFKGEGVLLGIPQDQERGTNLLIKAAQNGHVEAQFSVGIIYHFGCSPCEIKENPRDAAKWLLRAAEKGHPLSQFWLGHFYKDGDGVIVDQVEAYKWFNLSSAGGVSAGKYWLEKLSADMSSSQIQEAQKLSREWLEKHKEK